LYKFKKTGPFILEKIITDDDKFLKLEFNDLNTLTNNKNIRKLSKGGNWPQYFSKLLEEKAKKLIGEKVYVITSQTTGEWSTEEWLSDIEKERDHKTKLGLSKNLKAADGISDLKDHIAICENFHIIDHSLLKETFSKEYEYEDFYKNLEKEFFASWSSSKTARNITNNIKRIRISGLGEISKRSGYRVVIWNVSEIEGFNFYIAIRKDKKIEVDILTSKEKKEAKDEVETLKTLYTDEKIIEAFKQIFSPNEDDEDETIGITRLYINCPYSEKDECKSLGGKWDPEKKSWYIPDHLNRDKFKKWI